MQKIFDFFNFENVGGKIKTLAKWSCWITIVLIWISAPITFLVLLADDAAEYCWIPIIGAFFCSVSVWVGSWTLYAFGEFVENTQRMCENTDTIVKQMTLHTNGDVNYNTNVNPVYNPAAPTNYWSNDGAKRNTAAPESKPAEAVNVPTNESSGNNIIEGDTWVCRKCNSRNLISNAFCWRCNNQK